MTNFGSIAEYAREETLVTATVLLAAEQAVQDVYRNNPDIEDHYASVGRFPLAVVIAAGGIFSKPLNPFEEYLPGNGSHPGVSSDRPKVMDRAAVVFYNGVRKREDHLELNLFRNDSHAATKDLESAYQNATYNFPRWMLNAFAKVYSMQSNAGLLSLDTNGELYLPFGALNKGGGVSIEDGKTRIAASGLLQPDDSSVSRAIGWGLDLARQRGLSVATDDELDMIDVAHDLRTPLVDVLMEDAEDMRDISEDYFGNRAMAGLTDLETSAVLNEHTRRRLTEYVRRLPVLP